MQPLEVEQATRTLTLRPALDTLPSGMTAADLIGALKLAMLTESATDTYAETILERAERYEAPWLARFINDVWAPDEALHFTPYMAMLLSAGVSQDELDCEIERTRHRALDYHSGDTPAHLTTYGMIQEYVTDNWHGLIAKTLRPTAPLAARLANHVKQRETLHTIWYRNMTAIQLEANPALLLHVAEAAGHFEMPGSSLVPELDSEVQRWLPLMGNDFDRTARDLARLFYPALGDTKKAGRLIVEVAAQRGTKLGPLSPQVVRATLNRLGGPGYGLLGEAMMERMGLGYLYRDRLTSPMGRHASLPSRLRGMLRRWLATQLELSVEPVVIA